MRVRYILPFLAVALASTAFAADPAPAPVPIRLPLAPVLPQPMPGLVQKLGADQLYVIDSDVPVVVLASPAGIVTIGEEAGPITIKGKFVDSTSKRSISKKFTGKQVFIVEAAATGRVELMVVPLGLKTAADVIRVTLDVDDGTAPQPPPPGPGPAPAPTPVPVTSFRVILISETADTLTPAQRSVLDGKVVEDFLNATCTGGKAGWRRRDKDQAGDADPTMAAMWTAVKAKITTTPCVAVGVNEKVDIIPLAATPAEMVATLKTYAGVK